MISIRYADINDAEELGRIHSESWKAAYKGIVPDSVLDNITVEKRKKYFYNAIAEKREKDALLIVDDIPAGFICIGGNRDEDLSESCGEIWGIYLHPDYWDKGLGKVLINWGIEALSNQGYSIITLWVLEENTKAISFYKKIGFRYEGDSKNIDIGKTLVECRYVYRKNL